MPLPPLNNWDSTRIALHRAAQVAGAVRKALAAPLPNYAHLGLYVTSTGLTTGKLPDDGQLFVDFTQQVVTYICPANSVNRVEIAGKTQTALMNEVLAAMEKTGHPAQGIDREKVAGQDVLNPDPVLSADYATALNTVYTAIARFRGRLLGGMSPLIVWPHGFDLSMLWFKQGFEERSDPHLNVGFSPGSPGFVRPYVYTYAHPIPPGLLDVKLPEPARWHTQGWTGAVIDYDRLAMQKMPVVWLEDRLHEIFAAVSPLLS